MDRGEKIITELFMPEGIKNRLLGLYPRANKEQKLQIIFFAKNFSRDYTIADKKLREAIPAAKKAIKKVIYQYAENISKEVEADKMQALLKDNESYS